MSTNEKTMSIPRRVCWEVFERGGEYGSLRTDIRAYCPTCGSELPHDCKGKCVECGQALDWGMSDGTKS